MSSCSFLSLSQGECFPSLQTLYHTLDLGLSFLPNPLILEACLLVALSLLPARLGDHPDYS